MAVGDTVETGQLLGYSGASGDVKEPHLHFAAIRTEKNSAGWQEEISVPVKFYVGVPPVVFSPRASLIVKADYSGIAEVPRAPSEAPLFPCKRPTLKPGEEWRAWGLLARWLACGVAGLAWYGSHSGGINQAIRKRNNKLKRISLNRSRASLPRPRALKRRSRCSQFSTITRSRTWESSIETSSSGAS